MIVHAHSEIVDARSLGHTFGPDLICQNGCKTSHRALQLNPTKCDGVDRINWDEAASQRRVAVNNRIRDAIRNTDRIGGTLPEIMEATVNLTGISEELIRTTANKAGKTSLARRTFAYAALRAGFTNQEIGEFVGTGLTTVKTWRTEYEGQK